MFVTNCKMFEETRKKNVNYNGKNNNVLDETLLKESRVAHVTEFKLGFICFAISFFIVIGKLLTINRTILQTLFGKWSDAYRLLGAENYIFSSLKNALIDMTWLLVPLLTGIGFTCLTWLITYKDSCIPGIKPPTPFSPMKQKKSSAPILDTGYAIAVLIGLIIFLLMVFSW